MVMSGLELGSNKAPSERIEVTSMKTFGVKVQDYFEYAYTFCILNFVAVYYRSRRSTVAFGKKMEG